MNLLLALSLVINVALVFLVYGLWTSRKYNRAMLHSLLKMIRKNSGAVRRIRFEPWRDEYIDEAVDAVDRQFSIVHTYLYPSGEFDISLMEPPKAVIPQEPTFIESRDDEGEEWKKV